MKVNLRVLHNNAKDLRSSLLLRVENKKHYLFNTPENLQRTAYTYKDLNLFSKHLPEQIFVSSLMPDHMSGLYGYYHSLINATQSRSRKNYLGGKSISDI